MDTFRFDIALDASAGRRDALRQLFPALREFAAEIGQGWSPSCTEPAAHERSMEPLQFVWAGSHRGFRYTVSGSSGALRIVLIVWNVDQARAATILNRGLARQSLSPALGQVYDTGEAAREVDASFSIARRAALYRQSCFSLRLADCVDNESTRLVVVILQLNACLQELGYTPGEVVQLLQLYLVRMKREVDLSEQDEPVNMPESVAARWMTILEQGKSAGVGRLLPQELHGDSAAVLESLRAHAHVLLRRDQITGEPDNASCTFLHELRHFFFNQIGLGAGAEMMGVRILLKYWSARLTVEQVAEIGFRIAQFYESGASATVAESSPGGG